MKQKNKWWKKGLLVCAALAVVGVGSIAGINLYMSSSVKKNIISLEDAKQLEDVDCVLILGCGVKTNGKPSDMLVDRLDTGIKVYQAGVSDRLLMSGDHGRVSYDEVNTMKNYAMERDIPSEHIFMDHAGFSTYESLYRANEIFQADKVVIITQGYHMYRALYIADKLGMEAYGVTSDVHAYRGQTKRDVREIAARVKDFFACIFRPEPTYLGDSIPVSGDGNQTNDTK